MGWKDDLGQRSRAAVVKRSPPPSRSQFESLLAEILEAESETENSVSLSLCQSWGEIKYDLHFAYFCERTIIVVAVSSLSYAIPKRVLKALRIDHYYVLGALSRELVVVVTNTNVTKRNTPCNPLNPSPENDSKWSK